MPIRHFGGKPSYGYRRRRRTYRKRAPARRYSTRRAPMRSRTSYRKRTSFRGRRSALGHYKKMYVGPFPTIGAPNVIAKAHQNGLKINDVGYKPSPFTKKVLMINNDLHQYRWLCECTRAENTWTMIQFHPSLAYDNICRASHSWTSYTAFGSPTKALFAYVDTERYILKQWTMKWFITWNSRIDRKIRFSWAIPRYKQLLSSATPDINWNHNPLEQQNSAYWKVISQKEIHIRGRAMPYVDHTAGTGDPVTVTVPLYSGSDQKEFSMVIPMDMLLHTPTKLPPVSVSSWEANMNNDVAPILFIDQTYDLNGQSGNVNFRVHHQFDYYHIDD